MNTDNEIIIKIHVVFERPLWQFCTYSITYLLENNNYWLWNLYQTIESRWRLRDCEYVAYFNYIIMTIYFHQYIIQTTVQKCCNVIISCLNGLIDEQFKNSNVTKLYHTTLEVPLSKVEVPLSIMELPLSGFSETA